MKTFLEKPTEVKRNWYVVDAEGKTLGRLCSKIAPILMGKTKPTYTPNVDGGDFVIVINADKVQFTGKKLAQKIYYRHSQYPGGLKETTAAAMMEKHPERVIMLAVKGMLPKNRLAARMLTRLRVYAGPEHEHQAQKPETITL